MTIPAGETAMTESDAHPDAQPEGRREGPEGSIGSPPETVAPRRPAAAALLGIAVAVVLIAAVGVRAWTWQADADDLAAERADRAAALEVGERAARLLVALDAETGAATLAELRQLATGGFATEVDTLADTVAGVLAQGAVSSQGEVAAAAVESAEPDRATVLIAATSLVTNTELPDGELRTFRMAIQVAQVDGAWLVSDVEFLA